MGNVRILPDQLVTMTGNDSITILVSLADCHVCSIKSMIKGVMIKLDANIIIKSRPFFSLLSCICMSLTTYELND